MTRPLLPWLDGGTSNTEEYRRQSRENKEINSGHLEEEVTKGQRQGVIQQAVGYMGMMFRRKVM